MANWVDPTEAEEELLDEQEMKEEAQEEVTVPETKDETVVPEVRLRKSRLIRMQKKFRQKMK